MSKAALIAAIPLLAFTALAADPVVGTITLSPTFAPPGAPAQIKLTASIPDPALIAGGANVQRLDATGRAISVAGVLHDDGANGDATAGDNVYTLVFTINEANAGRIFFRASAAFRGVLQRVGSSIVAVDIGTAATPLAMTASVAPPANPQGWNNTDATVTWNCTGGAGGSLSCPAIVRVSTEGKDQVISASATDGASNTTSKSVNVSLDKTAPVIVATVPLPGAILPGPFFLVGTVTDALSGVASLTCAGAAATITGQSFVCGVPLPPGPNNVVLQATDVAGNKATTSVSVIIGSPALTISAAPMPAPNAAGWNRTNVTVAFTCSGGVAPLTCPPPVVASTEAASRVISGTVTDSTGKTASTSFTVKLDKTPPDIAITVPTPGTIVTTPQLALTGMARDGLSGLASVTCNGVPATLATSNITCNLTLVPGPNAIAVQATDIAGNVANASVSVTFTSSSLTISAVPAPPPNAAGWNNSNVAVSFACGGGSAPLTCPPPVTVSAETANRSVSGTVTDSTGKTAVTSTTVKLDKTPPVIGITSPAPGAVVVTPQLALSGTVTDALSGLAAVTCNGLPAVVTASSLACNINLAAGANTITVEATDIAGNAATSSVQVTFNAQSLTISSAAAPPANAAGWNNANVTVTYTCAGGAAPLTCPPPTVVSTESASQVVSGTVTDSAGKTANVSDTIKLDKTPPAVAITSPASGATVATPQLALGGTVSDALSGIATVTCNGLPAVVTASSLACNLTLVPGLNTITVQATDVAGNATTASIPVTLSGTTLSISAIPAPLPNAAGWNDADVTVSFACSGGVAPSRALRPWSSRPKPPVSQSPEPSQMALARPLRRRLRSSSTRRHPRSRSRLPRTARLCQLRLRRFPEPWSKRSRAPPPSPAMGSLPP